MKASLVLTNGRVYTQDPTHPTATAVAVAGNKILAVGEDSSITALLGSQGRQVDLDGRCVVPGLVDAHVHFQSYALGLRQLDLNHVSDLDEALARIAMADGGSDIWLQGRGWNQAEWPNANFPTARDLDRVQSDRPVYLRHKSGHAGWVNTQALRIANIVSGTPDPPGGQIQRDERGQPTGILFENAMKLVSERIPTPTIIQLAEAMLIAQEHCLHFGLTGIHDFDGRACFSTLQHLHANDDLRIRVVKNIPVTRMQHAIGLGLRTGFGDDWLRIGGVKIFADGALGPRTAAMIEPYEREPRYRGITVTDKEDMLACASEASANGLSVTVHAIGDKANHDVLDVFEVVRKQEVERVNDASGNQGQPQGQLRHRIEHAQILHPNDFQRLAQLDVIASMQPVHATSDMDMAELHWGVRSEHSYAWRSVLDTGATLVFGSDAPVDPIDPLTGIFAAVNRCRPDGYPDEMGWHPEQRLTLAEALHAYTMGAAVTSGREATMGSISPGKLADLTIFDRDIFSIPARELLTANVDGTIVDGKFVYRNW